MRLFICDPVCALPFGHNAVGLSYFGNAFRKTFNEVVMLSCKHLPKNLVQHYGFDPHYSFYYHRYLTLQGVDAEAEYADISRLTYADYEEAAATADAERLLDKYKITADDTIVFPSADFYGVVGLLNVLAQHPSSSSPRVLLRFIGVMETATPTYREPISELTYRIREGLDYGLPISCSAETPRLADFMAEKIEAPVINTPYPETHDRMEMPRVGPFVVFCPGSARADKGFFDLLDIFTSIRLRDRKMGIKFVAQSLSPRDAPHYQNYLSKLYALPGMELLPYSISDAEMRCRYGQANAILLPYDAMIYENRGSAGMMEAVCVGRPVVTLTGPAFAEQVQWYRCGKVVSSKAECADALIALSQENREKLERSAIQARTRYLLDVSTSYRHWVTGA